MADNSADTVTAPPWVSAQNIRSTSTILWSCIVTLTACIYTSLHLDVSTKSGWKQRLWQKAQWVIIAILAPELVVSMACSQYLKARWLVKELNKERERRKEEVEDVCPEFDLHYGFFVVMGGLQVSTSGFVDGDHINATLSAEAVISLSKKDEFLYVSRESIDDRSKADALKKALVVLQVAWMVIQCISRKSYGLPLTLLEIHTMVHVVCAFILYICWFEVRPRYPFA
ncbi:hypothetical protein F4813DRAFT_389157 [Daldinia decipiens]|uniref:uncharacterized protein n=1 Tax=Daldinia decipiens TaxID=326647 RepID=UPI0020C2666E|nr:uncharacterized protein F4813DRAFT_389157 [Daldinia decipiens]KAI1657892.1 hypothetical protein F4813DRAFT_389157 [Daldinia decipiens]